ncbi:flagellin N-terminal helical domain-containing protein [Tindallia californiensis]|uniref:Flagellin n=1 Tax=Tindallia californiensis TaxID=159292 RepID=A0A1H3L8W7_9FIRM|nr:flagellin [Tindallia californiensis]SDY60770.1 flagellin [Tindallia californiensis]
MRINHNIPALNAHRILSRNNNSASETMERLSSGRRINRAKDDAAGMAISEKMKTQIRGLRKASQNTLDGISLIQTAEGAMNEVHSMLQRMRELAVQSANGTTTDDDREAIQSEIDQLTSEVNRIANGTEFNTRNLLRGNEGPNSNTTVHRMSTGEAATIVSPHQIKGDADLSSEDMTITIDGEERVIRLASIDGSSSEEEQKDKMVEVINDAIGDLGNAILTSSGNIEIRSTSVGGNSNIEIEGTKLALHGFGLMSEEDYNDSDLKAQPITARGKAEVDTGYAEGSILFDEIPEAGSTLTIGGTKIEFFDSSVEPYTGSYRPIDISDGDGNPRDLEEIIDIITGMDFAGIDSIERDRISTPVNFEVITPSDNTAGSEVEGVYSFELLSQPVAGETITIGGVEFTFTNDDSGVEIGADLDATIANLETAIGDEGTFTATDIGNPITITETTASGTDITVESTVGTYVDRIVFTATEEGFAGQSIFLEGTPKEFVANLQIGPNQGQGFRLSVGDIRAVQLNISSETPDGNTGVRGASYRQVKGVTDGLSEGMVEHSLNVSDEESATAAITVYNNAIIQVAQLRGELGAIQNRLEYTSANLDNTMENMTAALSRIEDADMALEMSEYTKMNVMMQAGTSMLAQANQQPQMVLQLLQG